MTSEVLTPELLAELKAQRISDEDIAQRFSVSKWAVRQMRAQHGIGTYHDAINNAVPVDELKRLKKKGVTDDACAEHFGVSKTVIKRIRKQHGIIAPKAHKRLRKPSFVEGKTRDEYMPKVLELYHEGVPIRQIGKQLALSESTLRSWLRPSKTPRRKPVDKTVNTKANMDIVYNWIVAYKYQHNGNSPTRDEIAEGAGFSRGYVVDVVQALAASGRIVLPDDGRAGGITIPGAQWIPPSGWRMPAKLRTREKVARPRRDERKRLKKEGRLCDCGRMATHYIEIVIGSPFAQGGRGETMPLCNSCAQVARGMGENVKAFEEMRKAA